MLIGGTVLTPNWCQEHPAIATERVIRLCPHPIPLDELSPSLRNLYQLLIVPQIGDLDQPEVGEICAICTLTDFLVERCIAR